MTGTDEEKAGSVTPAGPSAPQSPLASTPEPSDAEAQHQNRIDQLDVEALGRQRPPIFKSLWAELGFCISLVGSMLMAVRAPPWAPTLTFSLLYQKPPWGTSPLTATRNSS